MIVFLTRHYFYMFSNNVNNSKVEKEEQKIIENIAKEQKEENKNKETYFSKFLNLPEIPFSQMKFPMIPNDFKFPKITK